MTQSERPDPDALLASLKKDEARQKRGTLKIFFGMSPGVGKTYAMLLEARRDKQAGVDVVIGIVETHKRKETEALLQDLPAVPRRRTPYRGIELEEMDLDAILARRPRVVLVDEAAHTNAPGSRHPKRYQDIEELLASGISVYTTLNVQHLESRADIVRQITGAGVQETVPDSLFQRADEIQLVDLTPDDLRERLAEGRVYLGDAANVAAKNFFKPENLTALREMALRVAAEHTDSALRDAMKDRGIPGPWKAGERLLVGISSSPSSESLIRWTRRMAGALNCSWMAVCVEPDAPLAEEDKTRLTGHLALARQLGAEVMTIAGQVPAEVILRVARENNVTQIVVGKTQDPWWRQFVRGGSLAHQLIAQSGLIDIYVVQPDKVQAATPRRRLPSPGPARRDWVEAAAVTGALTVLFLLLSRVVGYYAIGPLYLLWVVVSALRFRRRVALAVGGSCAILWNFLFIPPRFTFIISTFHDAAMFFMFFVVSLAIGHLTNRLRASELAEQRRERRTATLFDLARQTALARDLNAGLEAAARLLENLLQARVALTLRLPDRTLSPTSHPAGSLKMGEKERSVASWVFSRRAPAGRFTDTLPDSEALHLPLQTPTGVFGILSIQPTESRTFDLGERDLVDAAASLIAAILEKNHFIEAFQRAELLEASESLRRALLDSVSHELKTPLAALQTGLETLLFRIKPDESTRESTTEIRQSLRRLQRVINNLLDMTRIQAGVVRPRLDWTDIEEMIRQSMELAGESLERHRVEIEGASDLPMVKLDQALLEQVLSNLLINAATWSPPNSRIAVQAGLEDGRELVLSVLDEGRGIPAGDLGHIFEKFYRSAGAPTGGAGLGLSIVQGFVKAHGGTVEAANRPEGGARFTLRLPVETMSSDVQETHA